MQAATSIFVEHGNHLKNETTTEPSDTSEPSITDVNESTTYTKGRNPKDATYTQQNGTIQLQDEESSACTSKDQPGVYNKHISKPAMVPTISGESEGKHLGSFYASVVQWEKGEKTKHELYSVLLTYLKPRRRRKKWPLQTPRRKRSTAPS